MLIKKIRIFVRLYRNKSKPQIMSTKKKNIPLHIKAEEAVKAMISSEEYQNGKLLPNEIELAQSLNISRNTLRQAINKLVYDGLLCRKRGYGTWVSKKTITSGVKNWMSFSQEMQQLGIKVKNYELHVSFEIPPEGVLRFFNIDSAAENKYCLRLERVRGGQDHPFVVFISWFNPNIGMNGEENFNRPLYEILESEYGITVHTSIEEISARLAGKMVASKLNLSESDPVLKRVRFVYDQKRMPIEYNIGYYKADSFTYTITAER